MTKNTNPGFFIFSPTFWEGGGGGQSMAGRVGVGAGEQQIYKG